MGRRTGRGRRYGDHRPRERARRVRWRGRCAARGSQADRRRGVARRCARRRRRVRHEDGRGCGVRVRGVTVTWRVCGTGAPVASRAARERDGAAHRRRRHGDPSQAVAGSRGLTVRGSDDAPPDTPHQDFGGVLRAVDTPHQDFGGVLRAVDTRHQDFGGVRAPWTPAIGIRRRSAGGEMRGLRPVAEAYRGGCMNAGAMTGRATSGGSTPRARRE